MKFYSHTSTATFSRGCQHNTSLNVVEVVVLRRAWVQISAPKNRLSSLELCFLNIWRQIPGQYHKLGEVFVFNSSLT